ncbi:MAG: carboxypeptidase regulatory-like domain-containing protein [Ignavibacteriota bacterium]
MKYRLFILSTVLFFLSSCSKKTDQEDATYTPGYKVVSVSNGGSISGTVSTQSGAVYMNTITTQKDQDVCGGSHPNPALPKVDGTVSGCIIGLEKISQGKDFSKTDFTFEQKGCDFKPHVQIVPLGRKIVVSNDDKVLHNYHINLNGQTVMNEAQPEGAPPREVDLKQRGLHVVTCDVHPWMKGFIFVADNPYYILTDSAGHFSLTDVPAGKYKLTLWRDNWNVEEVRNKSGVIESYKWGKAISKEQEVIVEAGKDATINFNLP